MAVDRQDPPRTVVLGACLPPSLRSGALEISPEAAVLVPEQSLRDTLGWLGGWLGGVAAAVSARPEAGGWTLRVSAPGAPNPEVPELGEPLVSYLAEARLGGRLARTADGAELWLPGA